MAKKQWITLILEKIETLSQDPSQENLNMINVLADIVHFSDISRSNKNHVIVILRQIANDMMPVGRSHEMANYLQGIAYDLENESE